ncbi:hypothetical protein SRABI106_02413 [Rahnella aquatilis]|nr:hypothetical protein SRABI106_02413 [Rahnella aquatilis]
MKERKGKIGGHDAHNARVYPIDQDISANELRIGSKVVLPHAIADNGNRCRARLDIFTVQHPATIRLDASIRKHLRRIADRHIGNRFGAVTDIGTFSIKITHVIERGIAGLNFLVVQEVDPGVTQTDAVDRRVY